MAAAARLNHAGYRTLLVERRDRVGGRASSMEVDAPDGTRFTVNTGALVFELDGENGRLFEDVGADHGVLVPEHPMALRLGGRDIALTSGLSGWLLKRVTDGLGLAAGRVPGIRPKPGLTLERRLSSLRAGPRTMTLARNLAGAFFGAEASGLEAVMFFDNLTGPAAPGVYGAHPEGSVGPWRALAEHYQRTGGELWLSAGVEQLTFDDSGAAAGALIRHDGQSVTVAANIVVSNAGPPLTVALCGDAAPAAWATQVRDVVTPTTLITLNFASRVPMTKFNGLLLFSGTRRLAYGGNITQLSPKMVPDGWHLYACASTPSPATGGYDLDAEVDLLKADLRAAFPEFATAQILSVEVCSGDRDCPAQWSAARDVLPSRTSIHNLWMVGDGVLARTGIGQSGCVKTARLAVEDILRQRDTIMPQT
jgi:phytoene dehydrogenase-like protein